MLREVGSSVCLCVPSIVPGIQEIQEISKKDLLKELIGTLLFPLIPASGLAPYQTENMEVQGQERDRHGTDQNWENKLDYGS